ncbi:MAG: nitroreductase family protein [Promethearchaeota archaeon]
MNFKREKSTILGIIRSRRSVRDYDPRPVEDWKIKVLLEALHLVPSSTNSQPSRVVIVTNRELIKKLAMATPGRIRIHPWLEKCPLIIVICVSKSKAQCFGQVIGNDYHLIDIGIAGEYVLLAAIELGLGTCWIGWIDKNLTNKNLRIPFSWEVAYYISVGCSKRGGDLNVLVEHHARLENGVKEGTPGIGAIAANKREKWEKIFYYNQIQETND